MGTATVPLLVGDAVSRAAAAVGGRIAATLGDDAVTFRDLDRAGNRAANVLAGMGVGHGDLVALVGGTSLRALPWFVGAARCGAVFAPVDPRLTAAEWSAVVDHLAPRLVVGLPGGHDHAALAGEVTGARLASHGAGPGADLDRELAAGSPRPVRRPAALVETDPHIAYLTSGSTGLPKAVLVSHRASRLRSSTGGGTVAMGLRGPGGLVNSFPLTHYAGWHYVMESWETMVPTHLVARSRGPEIADAVSRWSATGLYCIPAVWERVLDPALAHVDLRSLRHADTGTSAFGEDLVERIKRRLPGTTTSVLYGTTEMGRMAALPDHELGRHGSVGWPAWPGELRLSEEGEILGRSPTMMNGYLRRPDRTARVVVDGWYHTGDLGAVDADGAYTITGRTSEMLRSGGEWVAPVEVERALGSCPGVRDVAVIGLPDDRWGEVVCAVVVPRDPNDPPTLEVVRAHVAGRLAPHKQPRRLALTPDLPRTSGTDRLQRQRIREQIMAVGDDREIAP